MKISRILANAKGYFKEEIANIKLKVGDKPLLQSIMIIIIFITIIIIITQILT